MSDLADRLAPAALIARVTGINKTTIRVWAHRGKIRRYGTEAHPLYDAREVNAAGKACNRVTPV